LIVGFLMGCTPESDPKFHYFYERKEHFLVLLKSAYYQFGSGSENP